MYSGLAVRTMHQFALANGISLNQFNLKRFCAFYVIFLHHVDAFCLQRCVKGAGMWFPFGFHEFMYIIHIQFTTSPLSKSAFAYKDKFSQLVCTLPTLL